MYVINRPPRVRHFVACLSRSISQSLKTETVNVPICETKGVWSSSTFCQGKKKVIASIHWNCWSLQFLNWYLDLIWILCNITKAGPMCFSFGRKFDSELILFAVSKKSSFFLISWTQNKRAVLLLFINMHKRCTIWNRERERESLAFELRFYQLSPSGIGWVCWFLYSGHRAGFWMRHFGLGSKAELVAINSGSWSI